MTMAPCTLRTDCVRTLGHAGGCNYELEASGGAIEPSSDSAKAERWESDAEGVWLVTSDGQRTRCQPVLTYAGPLTRGVLELVYSERVRQDKLRDGGRFPNTLADPGMSDLGRITALGEEYGEACEALQEAIGSVNNLKGAELRKELIQLAAVAVAWVEYLEMRGQ